MIRTLPWQTPARNYYPLPKVLCQLGLSPGEIAVYSFLMYCENRTTYQCYSNIVSIFTVLCLEKIGTKLFKYFTCPCISILISKVSKISLHFKAPLFKA